MLDWLETHDDVVRIIVRVQPRASRSEVAGPHGDSLKIRLAAPPVDGEANRELLRFLARKLGVPASAIRITRGQKARTKTIDVKGVQAAAVARALLG